MPCNFEHKYQQFRWKKLTCDGRCFADTSPRFADASQIKKYRRMFCDCSVNIPRLVADHRRIFDEHFSWQNIANGSWKISEQALKILGIGEMLPHEYHEFRLFTEGSVIPPEHHLMLVNFHWECIGNAKKSPVGPRHYAVSSPLGRIQHLSTLLQL